MSPVFVVFLDLLIAARVRDTKTICRHQTVCSAVSFYGCEQNGSVRRCRVVCQLPVWDRAGAFRAHILGCMAFKEVLPVEKLCLPSCAKFRLAQLEGYTTRMLVSNGGCSNAGRRFREPLSPYRSTLQCNSVLTVKEWSTPSVRRPKFVRNARLALPRHKTVVEWWDSWAILSRVNVKRDSSHLISNFLPLCCLLRASPSYLSSVR